MGALNFINEEFAWDSYNPEPAPDAPELWFDPSGGSLFHPSAAIPPDTVREAVAEFTTTGQRPTCVQWQQARLLSAGREAAERSRT